MAKLTEKLMVALVLRYSCRSRRRRRSARAEAATGPQKAQLSALIAAAIKEGELSYWTPSSSPPPQRPVEAFRKQYGLPASFKVSHSLSVTSNLVTRVDQELPRTG